MKTIKFLPSILALCLSVSSAHAASLLLSYEFMEYFPGGGFAQTYGPTTTTHPAAITGGNVTSDGPTSGSSTAPKIRRMNIGVLSNENWNSSPYYVYFRTQAVNNTLATAVANDSYFSITLNPSEMVDLTQLTFFARNGALDATTASGFSVRSSLTGTTDLLHVDDIPGRRNIQATQPGDNFYSVDLTQHTAFQNVSEAVTFRFYLYGDSQNTETDFGTISFYGTVPEPTSATLCGLGAAVFLMNRRRRI
jgi:hypothetical protein